MILKCFFFSSRRRHTRFKCDWSSDVCSSDLKLPTEAQFHRAAYGTKDGRRERSYPWGDEAPGPTRGNFDFKAWDPLPVGSHPAGASAFGVHDLVGNGWEWTRTEFAAFPEIGR